MFAMITRGCRVVAAIAGLAVLANCGGQADASNAPPVKIAPRLELADLSGEWRLVELTNGPAIQVARTPRIVFFAERIRGHTGCNTVAGPLQVDETTLRLGRLAVSRVGCPTAESQSVEAALLRALRTARAYGMHGHQLVLVGEGRVELARFEATDS